MAKDFKEFLHELAKALEFSDLMPDSKGACLIMLKADQIPLLFEFDDSLVPNTILLSCEVAPIPQEIYSQVLEEALMTNHSIDETLSCKPDSNFLYLHRRIHPDIDASDLKKVIDSLANQARKWRKRLQEISQSPQEKREDVPPTFKMHQFRV